jgi:maleylacetate reductase
MRDFVHQAPATRVVFGVGSLARVPAECEALDLRRVLVIAGGSAAPAGDEVAAGLGAAAAGRVTRVAQHVPEQLAAETVRLAESVGADGVCCIGGGSATGLAKAVAVPLNLPIVAVPTTYAGSEATSLYGVTGAHKHTATDPRARPRTVIYDPALTAGLAARATATSGFNALAHAVAALGGTAYEPVAWLYAAEALRTITRSLPVAVRDPGDLDARGDLLWGAWLAGSALAATGGGLHHRLCHVLGGSFRLVHAEVHAVLLPHTLARDGALARDRVAQALKQDDPAGALRELARQLGVPTGLAAVGMPADQLDTAAHLAAERTGRYDPAWFRALLDQTYPDEREDPT